MVRGVSFKMRRFGYVIVLVVLMVACCKGDEEADKKQAQEMMRGLAQECKEKEGATDDDVDDMLNDKMPETQVQKCFHSCMQKQFEFSDGKKFLKEGFLKISMIIVGEDEEKQKIAAEIAEECDGIANADRCQLAVDIMTCIDGGLKKRGLKER